MLNSLLRFSCSTILLTCLLAAMYSARVSSLLILLFVSLALLPPSNRQFDIIVDPRWIVNGGSSFRDVSSACIIDSALENFKS